VISNTSGDIAISTWMTYIYLIYLKHLVSEMQLRVSKPTNNIYIYSIGK
jgi:hypothetical protein